MTYEETKQILKVLQTNYPQSFRSFTVEQGRNFLNLWSQAFQNVPVELVLKAVQSILYTDPREFAPNIGQVNCKILSLITADSETQASEVWRKLIKTISSVGIDNITDETVYEISPTLAKIYTAGDIKQLGMMNSFDLEQYERPRFIKSFKDQKKRTEVHAMETGKLLAIADPAKIEELGMQDALKIEWRENK